VGALGPMAGVEVALCNAAASGAPVSAEAPIAPRAEGQGSFAIAVPWSDSGQARLVTLALREGIEARVTDKAFTAEGRRFPRGTVVFLAGANSAEKMARLAALAREVGAHTVALASGWVEDGPNFGSESFVRLTLPRVAVAWDEGISQLSAGALRYVLEQRLGLPITPIRTRRLARADLAEYDVLLVPEGAPAGVLGEAGQRTIRDFVRRGGVLVAIGESLDAFSEGDNPLLAVRREAALGRKPDEAEKKDKGALAEGRAIASEAEYREAIKDQAAPPDELPGALLKVVAERDHFLSAGYDEGAVVLATGTRIYTPLGRGDGTNVLRFAAADSLIASGYVWQENQRQLAFKPYLMAQPQGRGLVIGFAHDPSTRAYLEGLDLLLANAVLVAPARVR
ncbi:MAG: carboxypeptidase, partial [Erythrobacter cryptus]